MILRLLLDGVISDLGPDQKLNDSTAIALLIHIPVYRNIAFMENLKAQIEDMKDENRDEDAQKCLKYIELWARMALLKDIILQRMAAIMPESQQSIRAGFYSVQSSLREKARNLFKFLWEEVKLFLILIQMKRVWSMSICPQF